MNYIKLFQFLVFTVGSITNEHIPMKILLPGLVLNLNMTIDKITIRNGSNTEKFYPFSDGSTDMQRITNLNVTNNNVFEQPKNGTSSVSQQGKWNNVGLFSMDQGFVVDYLRASKWGEKYPSCKGHRQSPIDISSRFTQRGSEKIWYHLQDMPKEMMLINTGNSVQLTGNWNVTPYLIGPGILPYRGRYKFSDVSFHWFRNGNCSEHQIDGKRFALEMQLVFYKDIGNKDVMSAVNRDDHIAIMSLLFQLSEEDGPNIENIINGLRDIKETRTLTKIATFPLKTLLPNVSTYYIYPGSITVPPCTETVTWLVMDNIQNISLNQMNEFRKIKGPNNETVVINSRIIDKRLHGPGNLKEVYKFV